jgi:hypothetical protein
MTSVTRRSFLGAGIATIVAPTVSRNSNAEIVKPHICLVHGAWHGAWAWTKLTPLLIQEGYSVSAIDLSGLGANEHRQAPEIGLHVHGRDLLNHLFFNDLRDVVVVAHSYAGAVLSEALVGDREDRIGHGIYLDAFRLGEGESVASFNPPGHQEGLEAAAIKGEMVPPRARDTWEKIWGLVGEDADWSAPRMRPMSARCFTEKVQGDPFKHGSRLTYMRAMQNPNPVFENFHNQAKIDDRFGHAEVDGHHNVMVIDPLTMRDALLAIL